MVTLIIILFILIIISALISATEISYSCMNTVRLKHLAATKQSARRALKLHENFDKVLSTLLIGNNIVNISAASIATVVFTKYYGNAGVTISTIVMTVIILIFSEVSPKGLAKERPEAFAMFISLPLSFFCVIFTPFTYLFDVWKKFLKKLFRLKEQPPMTEEEFKIMVEEIKDDGVINATEQNLINNALQYDETLVSAIMTPIENITMIELGISFKKIKNIFRETNYSRIPVYKNETNNIIGVLYRADFYEMLIDGKKKKSSFQQIIKPMLWTRPNIKISALFTRLQKQKQHIAMVGTNGKILGLITMEDIIEELLGEIEDKYDAIPEETEID